MQLSELVSRYDDRLRTADYAAFDASANGLQVGPEDKEVTTVAFGVDAAVSTIEAAARADADVFVVHHGLSWGGFDRVTGSTYERIRLLVENDIALYVSHLPLDGHEELGNAAGIADVLELENCERFGAEATEYIGVRGTAPEPFSVTDLREELVGLDNGGQRVQVLEHGPAEIEDIGIITGSGTDWIPEAEATGVDALITGEGKQQAYHNSKEAGIHVFLAGHYATETFGVRALQQLAEEWGLETTFIGEPTGL
ncbi:Nif3-like dinuclear metal center hexameric protein [Haladaptatus sp. DYSN1]|uniref:Nif3-like dinuclear metal center hexameric protein n=1 Tax=unclassified Haladaptatus TaxID=2622732 RepID=UPI002405852D|nr:Nif3-like dinuclear metal center hexameric protein [Haladaptatus sp. DYSN1]